MPHMIEIRIPNGVDINNLDSNKFEKRTEASGHGKITVLTYNDKPEKKGLEKIGQKISNFFSGVKNARNSLTAVKAWQAYGSDNIFGGIKKSRFNNGLIQQMATELNKMQNNSDKVLPEKTTANSKYTFTLSRTGSNDLPA